MTASEREALVRVTREDFCEAHIGLPIDANDVKHVAALCAEVERLTRERDAIADIAADVARLMHDSLITQRKVYDAGLTRLTAEVERLREDAARLDYMDAQRNWTRWMGRDTGDGYTVWPVSGNDSFRAAIDAARTTGGRDA